jgi:hypothetical protein
VFRQVITRSALVAGVLLGSVVIAVAAESGAPLDAAIASKEQQLSALKSDTAEAACDYAVDEPIIAGCEQLDAQAQEASPRRPASFLADEARCQSSCSSAAKLFYSPVGSDNTGEMVSLTGERYGDLANAFRYRSEYVSGCACKPKPWTAEAKAMFERRVIITTRTQNERILGAGAAEMPKMLTAPEPKVAIHVTSGRSRYRQVVIERPLFRSLFRPFRLASGA